MRIGILTGGGDVQPLNAVIAAAKRRAEESDLELIGFIKGWQGLLENKFVKISDLDVPLLRGGTVLKTSRINLYKIQGSEEEIRRNLENNEIR